MQFWLEYGLFLAKAVTLVVAVLVVLGGLAAIISRGKGKQKEHLEVTKLNEHFDEIKDTLNAIVLSKKEIKKLKQEQKQLKKQQSEQAIQRKRIFVLDFQGDIKASAVNSLREEISAILTIATPKDEVVVRLESPGGMVAPYGLAASQLQRLKEHRVRLTVLVDKIAASGGYLMACVADRVLAAPFALIGSIGVVVEMPNFNRFLKQHNIDIELITAGEYKRTLTMLGENTEKGRQKFREELEEIHQQFKDFVLQNRTQVNINEIATGEHWLARQALELKLIDGLMTSDDYLLNASNDADIYHLTYSKKKTLSEKISANLKALIKALKYEFLAQERTH